MGCSLMNSASFSNVLSKHAGLIVISLGTAIGPQYIFLLHISSVTGVRTQQSYLSCRDCISMLKCITIKTAVHSLGL